MQVAYQAYALPLYVQLDHRWPPGVDNDGSSRHTLQDESASAHQPPRGGHPISGMTCAKFKTNVSISGKSPSEALSTIEHPIDRSITKTSSRRSTSRSTRTCHTSITACLAVHAKRISNKYNHMLFAKRTALFDCVPVPRAVDRHVPVKTTVSYERVMHGSF